MSEVDLFHFSHEIKTLPSPGKREFLSIAMENWKEALSNNPEFLDIGEKFGKNKVGYKILEAIFGNSPYLTQCVLGDLTFFTFLIQQGSEKSLAKIYETLALNCAPDLDMPQVMKALLTLMKSLKEKITII